MSGSSEPESEAVVERPSRGIRLLFSKLAPESAGAQLMTVTPILSGTLMSVHSITFPGDGPDCIEKIEVRSTAVVVA